MCRIAAILSENNQILESGIVQMTNSMYRGGPDNEGVLVDLNLNFALGHRRLSIIDLSDQGNQPMYYLEDRYVIVFNGEIYNFQILKEELQSLGYRFTNNTDTEVILAGFDAWSEGLLNKMQGMFAFVIVDKKEKFLFAARDCMGIKPLYIGKKGGDFFFSSEVKGFLAIDPTWEVNLDWRIWFLTFGFLPEPMTTLKNVEPLSKGHYFKIDLESHEFKTIKWYSPDFCNNNISKQEAIFKTREILENAIKRHLIADVEVGVFLSGGVDSSILTLLTAANSKLPIRTLSIDFQDDFFSEKKYQELIIDQAGTYHHSFVVKEQDFVDQWKEIFDSLDQPTSDAVNTHFICKYAHEAGLKVVLSGLGGDEIFGGYPSFHRTEIFRKLQRLSILINGIPEVLLNYPGKKIEFLKQKINSSEYLLYRGLFTPSDTAEILHISEKEVWDIIATYNPLGKIDQKIGVKTKVSILETDVYMLNQLLKDSDMQSMWFGLELRVPFLDKELIEFVRSLPDQVKYPKNEHKYLLIEAFKDILPRQIWDRQKQGFNFPFDIWLKSIPAFQNKWYVPYKYYQKFLNSKISASRIWGIFIAKTLGNVQELNGPVIDNSPEILFTYLTAFGKTGGIEKMNRIIMHCLQPAGGINVAETFSLHDNHMDNRYFPRYLFNGFSGNKFKYIKRLLLNSRKWKVIIVGHLNLSSVIWMMRLFNPKLKIVTVTHGIEAWPKQYNFKKWILNKSYMILSVSEFTKSKLITENKISPEKIQVLPNCLDPFFSIPTIIEKPNYLLKRYSITGDKKIIFTLTRMKSAEKYKGYDNIIKVLGKYAKNENGNFLYILAGQAEMDEKNRIEQLIKDNGIEKNVIMPGFIANDEIQSHYQLSDTFIMPSKKEGFGIVFIEAAASGTQVIGGNSDGSLEALRNGELGVLVDPDNLDDLYLQIKIMLNSSFNLVKLKEVQELTFKYYNFKDYKSKFTKNIQEVLA